MNTEILLIAEQFKEAYEGEPWFGRNIQDLLREVNEESAFEKFNAQHSIVELVWHMVTWREFVVSRIRKDASKDAKYFEMNDWRQLDYNDKTLWQQGLQRLHQTQNELADVLQAHNDDLLHQQVDERKYDFRK